MSSAEFSKYSTPGFGIFPLANLVTGHWLARWLLHYDIDGIWLKPGWGRGTSSVFVLFFFCFLQSMILQCSIAKFFQGIILPSMDLPKGMLPPLFIRSGYDPGLWNITASIANFKYGPILRRAKIWNALLANAKQAATLKNPKHMKEWCLP